LQKRSVTYDTGLEFIGGVLESLSLHVFKTDRNTRTANAMGSHSNLPELGNRFFIGYQI